MHCRKHQLPDGLSVAYTDSIPLLAAFFRLLSPLLPETFQYFGWFTLVCFFLQGAFGARLLGLFAKGLRPAAFGRPAVRVQPGLVGARAAPHLAGGAVLCAGGAVYYVRGCREGRYAFPGLFVLNLLTITVHPYFVPMTYAVTLALVCSRLCAPAARPGHSLSLGAIWPRRRRPGGRSGCSMGPPAAGSDALYGYFSMNLNSLWNPAGVGGVDWSLFLPVQNQVGGNYDAFAYLGLGALAALAASLNHTGFAAGAAPAAAFAPPLAAGCCPVRR